MDLLSYVVVHLIFKSGPDEGFKKDQIKINTFFMRKFSKTFLPKYLCSASALRKILLIYSLVILDCQYKNKHR